MSDFKLTDDQILEYNHFEGEDGDVKLHTKKIVKTRKEHPCFFGLNGLVDDNHIIAKGDKALFEKALIDSDYWGRYYMCIPCITREWKIMFGEDTDE